jgi:hypothetical protein
VTFNSVRQQDRARIRLLNELPKKESNISTKFRKLLARLAPDKIEFHLSSQLEFINVGADFTWDLAKRRLEGDLTDAQKMAFLKSYYLQKG